MVSTQDLQADIRASVCRALEEDLGSGDITAALIPAERQAQARVLVRETAILCGRPWADEVFRQVDAGLELKWSARDGEALSPGQAFLEISGRARSLLTAERCALNFLQTLSGTATLTRHYQDQVAGTNVRILDTRKTIPGLRSAQKYAVRCGGGVNHRMGLHDAFLIKENHIAACGSIAAAVVQARAQKTGKPVEVETENLDEFDQALAAGSDIIMLDNFSLGDMREAVNACGGRAKLEASGGITQDNLRAYAETGVDYISIGALTKDIRAIDLSLRIISPLA